MAELRTLRTLLLGGIVLLPAMLVAAPAAAQSPANDAGTAGTAQATTPANPQTGVAQQGPGQGDIVVTARRRDERLQDVPLAVTAVRGSDLQRLSVVKPDDLPRVAPGMVVSTSVYGATNLTVTIRSQRQGLNNGPYDSSVGVYFNEVPQARTQGLNAGFFDLQSIQVLKGPQGTLFGRNTTGGALLITSAAPTDSFEGYAQGTYGNYDTLDFEGALNVPVNDKLQLRFAGKVSHHDGYFYSTTARHGIGNLDDYSWRASAKFTPTETLTNSLVVSGFHERDDGIVFKLLRVNPNGNLARNRDGLAQLALLANRDFWSTTALQTPDGTHVRTLGISNITTLDIGDATIKNIFGYRRTRSSILFNIEGDSTNSYAITAVDNGNQYSDELNLSGKAFGGNLDYFTGLFFFKEDNSSNQLTDSFLAVPIGAVPTAEVIGLTNANPITNTSYSAYGQATYHFGDSGFSLTGGVRYTHDKREITWRSIFPKRAPSPPGTCRLVDLAGAPLSPCIRQGSASYSRPTFTATADYKATPDLLFYGTYRRGYRSGGFTFTAYNPREAAPYRPETVDDFEIGTKGAFRIADGVRLRYDVAAYYDKYNDIQRQLTDSSKQPVAVYFVNAAKATIKGVEVSADLDAGPLTLSGSFSLSDAQYQSFFAPGQGGTVQDFTGAPFAGAPKYTATWLARYRLIDEASVGQVSVQGSGYYQSKSVSQDGTPYDPVAKIVLPQTILHSRHVVDARVEWANLLGTALNLQFYVRNLTKEKYVRQIQDTLASTSFGATQAILGDPRTYGVVARYAF